MALVHISLIEPLESFSLTPLRREIQRAFRAETEVSQVPIDLSLAFDPVRGQYDASAVLLRLLEDRPPGARAVLGLTAVDLFVPIFDYLFGMAQLDGAGSVLSTYRLKNELYGLPADEALFQERVAKEAIHEIGHNFGLIHCFFPLCVMNPSNFVEQIDVKSKDLCRQCQTAVEKGGNSQRRAGPGAG